MSFKAAFARIFGAGKPATEKSAPLGSARRKGGSAMEQGFLVFEQTGDVISAERLLRKEGFAGRINMKIYLAVALAATTGMRQGEIRALKKDCIEFVENNVEYENQAIITVRENFAKTDGFKSTKGKRVRHVPVSKPLAEELVKMADSNPYKNNLIFWSEGSADTPIAGSYINKYYYAALAAIGITEEKRKERNIDFHSLRHFFNSMLRGEVDDSNLRLIIGHQSERMSDNYTHEIMERILQVGKVSSSIIVFPKSS